MTYASCPASIVNAPIRTVWHLLTDPEKWGEFYDVRVLSVDPPGLAAVGQTVLAESGPRLLHLKLRFRFTKVDSQNYELGFDARFPFGVMVREDLRCFRLGSRQCRVSYHCNFCFPEGWRGAVLSFIMRRELDSGPAYSLSRLQRFAERRYADGPGRISDPAATSSAGL
jgi:hypothetical protein